MGSRLWAGQLTDFLRNPTYNGGRYEGSFFGERLFDQYTGGGHSGCGPGLIRLRVRLAIAIVTHYWNLINVNVV